MSPPSAVLPWCRQTSTIQDGTATTTSSPSVSAIPIRHRLGFAAAGATGIVS